MRNEKEEPRILRLQLLQSQINQHFLYNTLDTAVWLAEAGRNQEVVELLSRLSLFYRTALAEGRDVISLKEEMEIVRNYLKIQGLRFSDSMEYELILPQELGEIPLPKLTLQPLVENALYHGIRKKRGTGRIKVSCEGQKGELVLTVEDDGAGMKPERLWELRQALAADGQKAFGLYAVKERLRLYSGDKYEMNISSKEGAGTRIQVRMWKNG